jgi:hypothetical protein
MRQLKRSKQFEIQAESLYSTISAVERQSDVMEDAALQTEVARALKASAQTVKSTKDALKGAEAAVDDAQELTDMTEDLQAAFQQMSEQTSAPIDDDELEEELQSMMNETSNAAPEPQVAFSPAVRFESMPSAPKGLVLPRKEERASLLSAA